MDEWRGGTSCLGIFSICWLGGRLKYTTETVLGYASPEGVGATFMGVVVAAWASGMLLRIHC